jgi:hypothetical protein
MVGSVNIDHLAGEGLHPIVGRIPEHHGQVDLPERYAIERCPGQPNARPIDAHVIQGLRVHDVEPAALSISTLVRCFMLMIGSIMSGHLPGCGTLLGWSDRSKVMANSGHRRNAGVAGSAA